MGTGSRNFIGSTDFPSERSGTHLFKEKILYVFLAITVMYRALESDRVEG